MPIVSLDQRPAGWPIIGTLRKGAPRSAEGKMGADLQYFRIVLPYEPDTEAKFRSVYGERPVAVRAFLPYSAWDDNFEYWQEAWVAGGLVHRCDGKTTVLRRLADGSYTNDPAAQIACPGGCKWTGRLKLIIPELERLALVQAITSSKYDVISLRESLMAIGALRNDCRGIPILLRRKPRKISTPEIDPKTHKPTGKRLRREKWLLSVEVDPAYVQLQLQAFQQQALPGQVARPLEIASRSGMVNPTFVVDAPRPAQNQVPESEFGFGDEEPDGDEDDETVTTTATVVPPDQAPASIEPAQANAPATPPVQQEVIEGHPVGIDKAAASAWALAAADIADRYTCFRLGKKPNEAKMLWVLSQVQPIIETVRMDNLAVVRAALIAAGDRETGTK